MHTPNRDVTLEYITAALKNRTDGYRTSQFDQLLFDSAAARQSAAQQLAAIVAIRRAKASLRAARGNRLATADQLMKEAESAAMHATNPEAKHTATSFLFAAKAYIAYKSAHWDNVYAYLSTANAADCILEEQFGYEIMHGHRLQLAHNWLRTAAQQGIVDDACSVGRSIIGYLSGYEPEIAVLGPWLHERVQAMPESLKRGLREQVIREFGLFLVSIAYSGDSRDIETRIRVLGKTLWLTERHPVGFLGLILVSERKDDLDWVATHIMQTLRRSPRVVLPVLPAVAFALLFAARKTLSTDDAYTTSLSKVLEKYKPLPANLARQLVSATKES